MFQSIIYKNYIGYNEITKLYSYEYEITDSDLGVRTAVVAVAVVEPPAPGVPGAEPLGAAVINFYEENNLPVTENLFRSFLFMKENWKYKIEDIISWNLQYNPKYQKYHEEVQKYLMLL